MVDPKDVTPGYWYVKGLRRKDVYDIVCVYDGGEVNIIGSDDEHIVQEYIFEFIAPVPPPPEKKSATRPTIVTSDAEALAIREEAKRRAIAHARETGHPDDLPPIEGEDGSLRWESVQEVQRGQIVTRRKRTTDLTRKPARRDPGGL